MDKGERETCDLMTVESFSELPFIRPPPTPIGSGAIRLFGKEFGGSTTDNQSDQASKDQTMSTAMDNNISSRKFECHYCCRNFPTSQALGGHQNAHKRERQHAKRAHLHSSVDPMSFNRSLRTSLPMGYHSWSSLYGNTGPYTSIANYHPPEPINGSPLAVWQVPMAHGSSFRPRNAGINIFFNNMKDERSSVGASGGQLSSQGGLGYEMKTSMQDHVSLELRL